MQRRGAGNWSRMFGLGVHHAQKGALTSEIEHVRSLLRRIHTQERAFGAHGGHRGAHRWGFFNKVVMTLNHADEDNADESRRLVTDDSAQPTFGYLLEDG